ncbi:MAG: hypothetical protein KGL35_13505 [Bradyrhizobium sp.]|nr:hypothetical protein [Bradyrhizobium sp.]
MNASDWHPCLPGHPWGDDGVCLRCGAYEPEKRVKKVEYASDRELAGFALRMVVERMAFRIDVMNERGFDGVSISKGFATQIVHACRRGAELLENPEPAQAGLTAGGGSGSANVSEGVTGGGERAVGDAAGETGGHMGEPMVDDPAAPDPDLGEARDLAIVICPLPSEVDDGDAIERMPGDLLRAATMLGKLCDLVAHYEQLGLRQVGMGRLR